MPGQMMTCGPCAGPEPHQYTGDTWVCATCEHRRQEATIKELVRVLEALENRATAKHMSEHHEIIISNEERRKMQTVIRVARMIP